MKKLWITYAWKDNKNQDVDFIVQELSNVGLDVRLDRWNITAGQRLWEQIQDFIVSDEQCDGWLLVATENSLASEPCREEFAYALDRALHTRGDVFPVIALFPRRMDSNLIPPAIKTRLYLSLSDPDWKERIKAALEQRDPQVNRSTISSYEVTVHGRHLSGRIIVEIRPRAGRWFPVIAAVPIDEKDQAKPSLLLVAPSGMPTGTGMVPGGSEFQTSDGKWWAITSRQQATPTESLYVWLDNLPTQIVFGASSGPQYRHAFAQVGAR